MLQETAEDVNEYLANVYYHPKRAGSFGGAENLYRDVKEERKFKSKTNLRVVNKSGYIYFA